MENQEIQKTCKTCIHFIVNEDPQIKMQALQTGMVPGSCYRNPPTAIMQIQRGQATIGAAYPTVNDKFPACHCFELDAQKLDA